MADHSGIITLARMNIVQLRLSGLILAAMVKRDIISRSEAAALVREPMSFLDGEGISPETVALLRTAMEGVAADLEKG